jgi:selenoprotein W-related protein
VGERRARVEIEYCTQCRWLLRAAWLAQELLTTFEAELGEVALVPGSGGVLDVRLDGELIFSRASAGRFPESRELKQAVRDRVAPERSLGHSDRASSAEGARSEAQPSVESKKSTQER